MLKKLFSVTVVWGILFSVYGQNVEGVNARLDAIGGVGAPADFGWIVDKPSYLYRWPDRIQASGIIKDIEGQGKTYGAILVTKSFGEKFFVGMTMNDRKAMSGTFYTIARDFGHFEENFGANEIGHHFPNWPHLLFNIRPNENLSIGIGGYLENSKYDAKHTNEFTYTHQVGGVDTEQTIEYDSTTVRKYFGIGIIADARIWFGSFRLNPEFKMFIPKLDGTVKSRPNDEVNQSHVVSQPATLVNLYDNAKTTDFGDFNNLYIRAGAKLSNTINETFWILGLWYKTERFELERNVTADTIDLVSNVTVSSIISEKTWAFNKQNYNWWLACQPTYADKLLFSAGYFGGVQVYGKTPPPGQSPDSTLIEISHKVRLGAEGHIRDFWVFDEFLPRMGLTFTAIRELRDYKYNLDEVDSTSFDEDISFPYSTNWHKDLTDAGKGLKVSAGFGLRKGRGEFDLSFDVLNWITTSITGPGAAMATFGFYFGKKEQEKE